MQHGKNSSFSVSGNGVVLFVAVAAIAFLIFHATSISAQPTGANLTEIGSETAPADPAGSAQAQAGNITQLNIRGVSTTQTWQGYFGNVTGTIQLADSNDNVLYNWTLANPQGEVYATTNQSVSWSNVQCFNFTATGTYADDTGNAGATSRFGTNLTQLESRYNIAYDDVDGVNETFIYSGAGTHDLFYTNQLEFVEGECRSTRVYSSSGQGVSNQFEEVLLYEPTTTSVIYVALLEEGSVAGFDGSDYDFQMLVLEDGHGTNTDTTTYYFFVELE